MGTEAHNARNKTKTEPPVDPVVCPVSREELQSMSAEAFKMVMIGALQKLEAANRSGHLRAMKKSALATEEDIGNLTEISFSLCGNDYAHGYRYCRIKDALVDYGLMNGNGDVFSSKVDAEYVIDVCKNQGLGRDSLIDGIISLMKNHYYTEEELQKYTQLKNECIKRKKTKENKKMSAHLENAFREGEYLFTKYRIRFEYGYNRIIEVVYRREEITPNRVFFSKLIKDSRYSWRRSEYETIVKQIESATNRKWNIQKVTYKTILKDFRADARMTFIMKPNEKAVGYITNEGKREELTKWMLADAICSSDTLFQSVYAAMTDYLQGIQNKN